RRWSRKPSMSTGLCSKETREWSWIRLREPYKDVLVCPSHPWARWSTLAGKRWSTNSKLHFAIDPGTTSRQKTHSRPPLPIKPSSYRTTVKHWLLRRARDRQHGTSGRSISNDRSNHG